MSLEDMEKRIKQLEFIQAENLKIHQQMLAAMQDSQLIAMGLIEWAVAIETTNNTLMRFIAEGGAFRDDTVRQQFLDLLAKSETNSEHLAMKVMAVKSKMPPPSSPAASKG